MVCFLWSTEDEWCTSVSQVCHSERLERLLWPFKKILLVGLLVVLGEEKESQAFFSCPLFLRVSLAPGLWFFFNHPVECSLLWLQIVLWQVLSIIWIGSSGLGYDAVVRYVDKPATLDLGFWNAARTLQFLWVRTRTRDALLRVCYSLRVPRVALLCT